MNGEYCKMMERKRKILCEAIVSFELHEALYFYVSSTRQVIKFSELQPLLCHMSIQSYSNVLVIKRPAIKLYIDSNTLPHAREHKSYGQAS